MSSPSSVAHMLHLPLAPPGPASRPTSKNPSSAAPRAPFRCDLRPKSMGNRTGSNDLARRRVMKRRLRWKRIVTCRWKRLRTRIKDDDGPVEQAPMLGIAGAKGASRWAGPSRGNELTWDVQVHTVAYETEPEYEIRPGTDALCVCNLCHGICSVARVHIKCRGARVGMILRGHELLETLSPVRRGHLPRN